MLIDREPLGTETFDPMAPGALGQMSDGRARARLLSVPAMVTAFGVALNERSIAGLNAFVLLLALVVPLIGLLFFFTGRGLYQLGADKRDPRPSLIAATFGPSFVLGFAAARQFTITASTLVWALAAVAVAAATTLYVKQVFRDVGSAILFAFTLWFWSAAGCVLVDIRFDGSNPQIYTTKLIEKREHVGSKKHKSYSWLIGAWGPFRGYREVERLESTFNRASEGADIRVVLHPGLLGIQWYEVDP